MHNALRVILTSLSVLSELVIGSFVLSQSATAQPQTSLRIKSRVILTNNAQTVANVGGNVMANQSGYTHVILQFPSHPTADVISGLINRGIKVLADVPVNGLLVSAPVGADLSGLGVNHVETLTASDKVSAMLGSDTAAPVARLAMRGGMNAASQNSASQTTSSSSTPMWT